MPEEEDKTLEYLKREEVKTMQKDIAGLRETEAKQEREKISRIKTAEEIQKEQAREREAQKAAEERKLAEEAAVRREEEMKRLKEKREKEEAILEKEGIVKEGKRAEGFKEAMRETQAREEEERKRFLERVAAKAEGLPADRQDEANLPSPLLLPPMPPLAVPKKEIPKPFLRRPSFFQKLGVRIVLIILVLAIMAGLASFWYWYLKVRAKPALPPAKTVETKQELIIPAALITTEASRTLATSSLISQVLKEDLGDKQFTRLIIEDPEKNKVLGIKELFEAFEVKTPETFYDNIDNNFTLFVYSSQGINRLGLIAKVKGPDFLPLLKTWENTMEKNLRTFSIFLGKTGHSSVSYFREATYKDTVFRYLSFPPENLGICWALIDNDFILTFSGESMIKTIDKIK